jgi:hypothetical protein
MRRAKDEKRLAGAKMNNTKWLAIFTAVLGLVFMVYAKQTVKPTTSGNTILTNKIPDAGAVRILKLQRDMDNLSMQGQNLQQQLKALNETWTHDAKELEDVKLDVIKTAGRATADWDIDVNKLEFVTRATPPKVAKK